MLKILLNNFREETRLPIYITAKDEELENIFNHSKEKMEIIQNEVENRKDLPHYFSKIDYCNYESICYQIEEYLKENNISYAIDQTVTPNTIVINLPNERTK